MFYAKIEFCNSIDELNLCKDSKFDSSIGYEV